jgi:hypothetical protein
MSLINNDHCPDKKFWRCKRCKKELSIRKDSLFFGSHIKISIVLELLYWWCSKMSVTQAAKECDCNKETAVEYYKIFRSICVEMSMGGPRIGGPGTIVEIDEMKLGKRKFHRGKRVEGQWCFGGILRRDDPDDPIQCFVIPVEEIFVRFSRPVVRIGEKTVRLDMTPTQSCPTPLLYPVAYTVPFCARIPVVPHPLQVILIFEPGIICVGESLRLLSPTPRLPVLKGHPQEYRLPSLMVIVAPHWARDIWTIVPFGKFGTRYGYGDAVARFPNAFLKGDEHLVIVVLCQDSKKK